MIDLKNAQEVKKITATSFIPKWGVQIEDDLTEFPIQAAMLLTSCGSNSIIWSDI